VGPILFPVLRLVRRLGVDRAGDLCAWLMRAVGPLLRAHRIAKTNLIAAFPEKSPEEIEQILCGCWDNFGRTCGEFANLSQLWDFDPAATVPGRIVIDPAVLEQYGAIARDKNGGLVFSAHLANWELPAISATVAGINTAILFRKPDAPALASLVSEIRSPCMGRLIESNYFAPIEMLRALQSGLYLGILQDQPFGPGVDVLFFNRPIKANPLIAQLARLTERPIYGFRTIRLPGRQLRLEIVPPVKVVRDSDGKIDVQGTTQVLASIIEKWIREYPDQYVWQAHLFDRP
jgi:Kdo2-lipid IVA lauroyltransferase/acyltransferase